MLLKSLKLMFVILLLSGCNETTKSNNMIKITIYTAALGKEDDNYPQDIIDLYTPIAVSGKEYIPNITLKRIDLADVQELPKQYADDHSTKAEPKLVLKKEKQAMEANKIPANFSINKTSDFTLEKQRIAEYKYQDNIFYLKSKAEKNSYEKVEDLVSALQKRLSQNTQKDTEYLIVYSMVDTGLTELCNKAIQQAKANKQLAENAVAVATNKAKEAQQGLATITSISTTANEAIAKKTCPSAKTTVTNISHDIGIVKRTAENAVKTATRAVSETQQHYQKVEQALQQLAVCMDKQTIESNAQTIASEAQLANNSQQQSERAANDVNTAIQQARNKQQTQIPDCTPAPIHEKVIIPETKTDTNKQTHHSENKSSGDVPWAGDKNAAHESVQTIKRSILSEKP
jgi:uncharacterized protein with NRDE domain